MFEGELLFLDRDDINTDEIIPAKYLTEIQKQALKPHLFEDLKLDGFSLDMLNGKSGVVTRSNFGCGSSREHAPWALEVNDINVVIASGFARIFRQNMFNCGLLPIELSADDIDRLFALSLGKPVRFEIDESKGSLSITNGDIRESFSFELSDFHKELIAKGGWVEYAHSKY